MLKTVILDANTLGGGLDLSVFERYGEVEIYPLSDRSEVKERLKHADICIINKVKIDGEALGFAKRLKLVCIAATGYDNIDVDACRNRGIAVANVAGYSANSVSQLTLAMVLSASVHLEEYRRSVSDGTYSSGNVQNILTPIYHELAGKTWGVVGYGAIGKKVAKAAEALGCKVVVNKRVPTDEADCRTLDALLRVSDIVTVHVPLTKETTKMISKYELSIMKNGAFLVNVARGAVLDEEAVADAVLSGKLGFFGCDAYSTEPMPETHPYYQLRSLKNVILTPHMAWGAQESRERCMEEISKNIEAFLKGERRNRVD